VESDDNEKYVEDLKARCPSVFTNRFGNLKNHLVKLHIVQEVKPIRQKRPPTPIHLRAGIEKEIKQMLKDDVIEPVDGPTGFSDSTNFEK
jgi:hypothetical protein